MQSNKIAISPDDASASHAELKLESVSLAQCLVLLEKDACALTITRRLTRHLTEQYAAHQQAAGAAAWVSPDILTWHAWLHRPLLRILSKEVPIFLNEAQELALWERVIRDDQAALDKKAAGNTALWHLWQHSAAARSAQQAHTAVHEWRIEESPQQIISDDRAFLRWQQRFIKICSECGYLENAAVGTKLLQLLQQKQDASRAELPHAIVIVGFMQYTPLQEALLQKLVALGVRVVSLAHAQPKSTTHVACCKASDIEDELHRAVSWCRQRLLHVTGNASDNTMNDDASNKNNGVANKSTYAGDNTVLGVVISDLQAHRDTAARIFEHVLGGFNPQLSTLDASRLFHLSLGVPLAHCAIVATALELLEWLTGDCDYETLSRWMRSPFLHGAEEEMVARARLDRVLRDTVAMHITSQHLSAVLRLPHIKKEMPAQLNNILRDLLKAAPNVTVRQSPAEWSVTFNEYFSICGWPGARKLDSHEYQALNTWGEVQQQFVSLGLLESAVGARRAFSQLAQIAGRRVFNPDAVPAPVQVMGVAEAAGLNFTALWVTGMSDTAWPPPLAPLPFLPVGVQRRLGMPQANREQGAMQARATIQQLQKAAPEVVFSYAEHEDDKEVGPSVLLGAMETYTGTQAVLRRPTSTGTARAHLEQLADGQGAPLATVAMRDNNASTDAVHVHGGAGLFKDQAACAFRAFALHRLGSESIGAPRASLNAMDHGSLVHDVLQKLWGELKDQHTLQQAMANKEKFKSQVARALDVVLMNFQRRNPGLLSRAARDLQKESMLRVLMPYFQFESERAPFTVVAREEKLEKPCHGLSVRVRIDRMDEIAGRGKILIDYKTGDARPASWLGARPDEPQLPLYQTLLADENIQGLAFMRVRREPSDGKYIDGLCAEDHAQASGLATMADMRGLRKKHDIDDWPQLKHAWQQTIASLAEAIATGEAAVNPKQQHTTCRYCDQHALCRIYERD